MATQQLWFDNNDMAARLAAVQSSTMGSTEYLNSSTGVTVDVWSPASTTSTENHAVSALNMPYSTGTNGRYDVVVQSTAHSMDPGDRGMAVMTVNHSGLNAEWRVGFWVKDRGSS